MPILFLFSSDIIFNSNLNFNFGIQRFFFQITPKNRLIGSSPNRGLFQNGAKGM